MLNAYEMNQAIAKGHPEFARAYLEMSTIDVARIFLKSEKGWEPT